MLLIQRFSIKHIHRTLYSDHFRIKLQLIIAYQDEDLLMNIRKYTPSFLKYHAPPTSLRTAWVVTLTGSPSV